MTFLGIPALEFIAIYLYKLYIHLNTLVCIYSNADFFFFLEEHIPSFKERKRVLKPMNELKQIMAVSSHTHFCVLFTFSKRNHITFCSCIAN